jgi:hypothetical protein
MGLENFMDIDSDKTESKSRTNKSSKSKDTPNLEDKDGFTVTEDGDVTPKGPHGYETYADFEDTVSGEFDRLDDRFKFNSPIYPQILLTEEYTVGKRYTDNGEFHVVSCVSREKTKLKKINRELIMLDTGETSKEACMKALSDRFSQEVTGETEVYLYIFANTRHIVKLAMADALTDDIGVSDKDKLLKAVYGESWTQQFRDMGGEVKGINEIEIW